LISTILSLNSLFIILFLLFFKSSKYFLIIIHNLFFYFLFIRQYNFSNYYPSYIWLFVINLSQLINSLKCFFNFILFSKIISFFSDYYFYHHLFINWFFSLFWYHSVMDFSHCDRIFHFFNFYSITPFIGFSNMLASSIISLIIFWIINRFLF